MEKNSDIIREDFPILKQQIHGNPLIYFDNAATTQKPQKVINRINDYYQQENANIHRGVHYLAETATFAYETARKKIADFIHAASEQEIIFTSGTTMGINLLARTFGNAFLTEGDEIILSEMEHHSNLVPWHILAKEKGLKLKHIPVLPDGQLDMEEYKNLLTKNAKLVSIAHMSNVLGTINPVKEIIDLAHANGSKVIIDGAQGAPHIEVNVQALDCDFYVFSAHKMLGPTGIGALYGKAELLDAMPPFLGGGEMIDEVFLDHSTYGKIPHKFEAGTPNIAGGIGFGAAIDYIEAFGIENIHQIEKQLTEYATRKMMQIPNLDIYGTAPEKGGVISFNITGVHPLDLAQYIDQRGIAIRSGHHCAQPLLTKFSLNSTARASFYLYNTKSEIDYFVEMLLKAKKFFRVE
jgi:cysteine desulfurase/selenocysteine lyase